jgi:hypothetical protein
MTDIIARPDAGYAFIKGGAHPFSLGVACLPGHTLTRVRLRKPLPLAEGLAQAAKHIKTQGRPLAALAACELRSPAQMNLTDFATFNRTYVELLEANGFPSEAPFPMARSNVAPTLDRPATNTLYAFTYAVASPEANASAHRDFLISGKAELDEDSNGVRRVIAEGDHSAEGTEKKATFVFDGLRVRVRELGAAWSDITGIQSYTARPIERMLALLQRYGLAHVGLTVHPAHPPVAPYQFEADVRAVSVERVV